MKIKYFVFAFALLIGIKTTVKADEGMWVPLFIESLNYQEMKEMGLKLTADQIYSTNHSSLKDAIAIFGRGCTSEVISDQGLLLTNHHCGYGQIQAHSSVEHDYLTEGFWAESMEDELPNPGLTATFLIRIEDVTAKVLNEVNDDMTEEERYEKIRSASDELKTQATDGTHYNAMVRSFFEGNEYYMFVYETYNDVRLVGAPPSSVGKYGADTDNWMWPRHTGDFSIFRIYTDKDGNPAEYSEDNIPLKPRHFLPVSIAGVEKGDFAMIMGYPGSTQRYLTSWGVKMALDISNQTVVDVRDKKLKIMMEDMQADPAVRIKYASKYARTSNYWKYFIGQTKGLKRLKVYDKKKALEEDFRNWVGQNAQREEKYGEALDLIASAYDQISKYEKVRIYQREAIMRGSEIIGFAADFSDLKRMLGEDTEQEKIDAEIQKLKEEAVDYFKDYNLPTDKKLLAAMMEMYHKNIPADQQPDYLKEINKKYKGDYDTYAEKVFDKSVFTSLESVNAFLDSPSAKKIDKDPAYEAAKAFNNFYVQELRPQTLDAYDKLDKGNRLFVAGLREMQPDKKFYPDANFTMRLTYGQVLDYYPADAVHYNYYTTLEGVMEKEDPNNWEFVVPEKLKELYNEKDYGPYGEGDVMKVCFLTNHDITGGNSGSPVINGRGELIGLAFDGNWEAMSGDIAFEPELQRTINVDIRYVLFIIDKYAGAKRLIDEMKIVKTRVKPNKEMVEKTEEEPAAVEN
ncbi:MAG: S46 family peptidase [Bacteroidales bacterium]|nr:S46 family peptidase [Bacteroidales bacterium]